MFNMTHAKRLIHLTEKVLVKVSKKHFNLGSWGHTNCETVACAVGYACLDKKFNKEGLFAEFYCGSISKGEGLIDVKKILPMFAGQSGFRAAELFFGLDNDECNFLFRSIAYINPTLHNVIARIRKFTQIKIQILQSQDKIAKLRSCP